MLELKSITFKDSVTCNSIEVDINGSVTADYPYTQDDHFYASLFAGIVIGAGYPALADFIKEHQRNK